VKRTIAFRRKAADRIMKWVFTLCALLVILPLFLILFDLLIKGGKELKLTLLMDLPHPVGEPGGGIANGIAGTFIITLLAMLWSVPTAVMSGSTSRSTAGGSSPPPSGSRSTR
jgi:phosphate transport system permease protein